MTKALRTTFLVHSIVFVLVGAALLLFPGRVLVLLNWTPIEPIVVRLLGAALLGLAWSSYRGWRATQRSQVAIVLELEAAFAVLGCIGLLRHLLTSRWPLIVWVVFAVLLAFAVAWIVLLVRRTEGQSRA
jgi:hypothetical protein